MVHTNTLKARVRKYIDRHARPIGVKEVSFEILKTMPYGHWRAAATACGSRGRGHISIRRTFLERNWENQRAIEEVIMHELIHLALPPGAHHGKLFREKCLEHGIHPRVINGGKVNW